MNIFFDTEFTGLNSDPRLLSLGLVTDDGHELYLELTDGWSDAMCSPWVRQHVLPLLGQGERLTRKEAGPRIIDWLSSFSTPTTLVGDTDWDTTLLANLMDECGMDRGSYRIELIRYSSKAQAMEFEDAKRAYFESQNAVPHHALTDARAFQMAWKLVISPQPR